MQLIYKLIKELQRKLDNGENILYIEDVIAMLEDIMEEIQ